MTAARGALVLLIGAALLVPMLAAANHEIVSDGNDTKGRLDIKKVKTSGLKNPEFKVVTHRTWSVKKMWDIGFVMVSFDTFDDKTFDYYALVRSNGKELKGRLYKDRARKPDKKIAKVKVWRDNNKSVTVRVHLEDMRLGGKNNLTYRWFAQTILSGTVCKNVCFDFAPNNGAIKEPNGKPTPTPTVSTPPTPDGAPPTRERSTPAPTESSSPPTTPTPTTTPVPEPTATPIPTPSV